MKVLITLLSVLAIAFLAFTAVDYFERFGSIEGIAFLETGNERVRPIPDLRVFLVREAVIQKVDSLVQQYTGTASLLEQKVEREKAALDAMKALLDQEAERLGSARETDPEYRQSRQQYFDRYNRYMDDKAPLDRLKVKYNEGFKKLIEKFNTRQVVTDRQGQFEFSRVKAGYWYLYAFYGNFLGNIAWFERVQVRGRTRVLLSRKNTASVLK